MILNYFLIKSYNIIDKNEIDQYIINDNVLYFVPYNYYIPNNGLSIIKGKIININENTIFDDEIQFIDNEIYYANGLKIIENITYNNITYEKIYILDRSIINNNIILLPCDLFSDFFFIINLESNKINRLNKINMVNNLFIKKNNKIILNKSIYNNFGLFNYDNNTILNILNNNYNFYYDKNIHDFIYEGCFYNQSNRYRFIKLFSFNNIYSIGYITDLNSNISRFIMINLYGNIKSSSFLYYNDFIISNGIKYLYIEVINNNLLYKEVDNSEIEEINNKLFIMYNKKEYNYILDKNSPIIKYINQDIDLTKNILSSSTIQSNKIVNNNLDIVYYIKEHGFEYILYLLTFVIIIIIFSYLIINNLSKITLIDKKYQQISFGIQICLSLLIIIPTVILYILYILINFYFS